MTTDTVGGVWTYAVELARAVAPAGVTVALAAMGGRASSAQRRQVDALENVRLVDSDFKLEWMNDPWADVEAAGEWLLDLERTHRPDVVHLNTLPHGALPFRAPVVTVGHSCVCSWWQAVKGEPAPAEWDRYRREVTRGLRGSDLIVAPSRAMLASLVGQYGAFTPDMQVIPNGRSAAPYRHDLPKENVILSAGRLWDEAKNVAALAKVAPSLDWPVRVAGDDRHPGGSRAATASVTALGFLDEAALADELARAAIYALPARYEPFGLSVLEAALCGCALVLGDIPSLREVWDDAACYVHPDDVDGLHRTLTRLIEDPVERRHMGRCAWERARRYRPQRMANDYLAAYQRLTRRAATGPLSECLA